MIKKRTELVVSLTKQFPRSRAQKVRGFVLVVLLVLTLLLISSTIIETNYNETLILGAILIMSGLYIELLLMQWYVNSEYFKGLASISGSGNYIQTGLTFDAATVLLENKLDITRAFLTSTFGTHIYVRAELTESSIRDFLQSNRTQVSSETLAIRRDAPTTLFDIVEQILLLDESFVTFLYTQGCSPDILRGATQLVLAQYYQKKRSERWWGRDMLSKIQPIGTSLTTGAWLQHIPYLDTWKQNNESASPLEKQTIEAIEAVLQTRRDSNVLLVAPDTESLTLISEKLQYSIQHGGLGSINGIFLGTLDHDSILGSGLSSIAIEQTLRTVLNRAAKAGTVTIVFNTIATLIGRYAEHGVVITHILEEMLAHDRIHLLVLATPEDRLFLQQHHAVLLKRCHEIVVAPLTKSELLEAGRSLIETLELQSGALFSYQALVTIADGIATYEQPTPAVIERLLGALCQFAKGTNLITGDIAARFLAHELGVPTGPIDSTERDTLINLEQILHQHIVGQDRAIHALAGALRRSRTGLTHEKPVQSFLFLGPSGVGKTETAKALATHLLNSEQTLVRFDMTEYGTSESVSRMLGTSHDTGRLTDHLTNHPRALILLDEFEKAHELIKNLFLQILDEGAFTNAQGTTISLKGSLIIATSNAGSELIAKTGAKRADAPVLDATIIDHIIREHDFAPELIGRFDEVIIFDALTRDAIETIAQQQITILTAQLRERGYELVVTDDALQKVLQSTDTTLFGARSIRHHITTNIGDAIATEIIRGTTPKGGRLTISEVQIV